MGLLKSLEKTAATPQILLTKLMKMDPWLRVKTALPVKTKAKDRIMNRLRVNTEEGAQALRREVHAVCLAKRGLHPLCLPIEDVAYSRAEEALLLGCRLEAIVVPDLRVRSLAVKAMAVIAIVQAEAEATVAMTWILMTIKTRTGRRPLKLRIRWKQKE